MGTLLVSDVIARAQNVLNDVNVRWPTAELIAWINDAQREIATVQPESTAKTANVVMTLGTKQTLPAGAIALIRLTRNMGVGGTTPGEAPRPASMLLMDLFRPLWHTDTATVVVKNYMPEKASPRNFYVWPPMSAATYVEAVYSIIPTPVAATTDTITLDDFYLIPITDHVLSRCFSKDAENQNMMQRAAAHRTAFENALGMTAKAEPTPP